MSLPEPEPVSAPGAPAVPAFEPLSVAQARVLATLMEKARTVPDSYPPVSYTHLTLPTIYSV